MRGFATVLMSVMVILVTSGCTKNNVKGEVDGRGLKAVESIAMEWYSESSASQYLVIAISDFDGVCSAFQRNANKANGSRLYLALSNFNDEATPDRITQGTFDIKNTPAQKNEPYFWLASLESLDASCTDQFQDYGGSATGGSITIGHHDSEHVVGTFKLVFENGGSLEGEFDAPICNATPDSDNAPTCEK